MDQGCELVRIALTRHKTHVTRIVAIALRFLKKSNPGLKLVVSFADPEHGHHGGIYQAGGWIYSGKSQASDEYIFKGKRWQGRSFRNKYRGMEKHPSVTVVKGSSKHRYLMPLDEDIKQSVLQLSKPYPKRAVSVESGTSTDQVERGGESPTTALQINEAENAKVSEESKSTESGRPTAEKHRRESSPKPSSNKLLVRGDGSGPGL